MNKIFDVFVMIAAVIMSIGILIFFISLAYEDDKEKTNYMQPEIIEQLQEDSKFVKITIDIIKETEVIENE